MAAGDAGRFSALLKFAPPWVLGLFGLGILVRLALVLAYRPGFLGFPDSQGYVEAAADGLFDNSLRTGGYAFFLRVVHALSDDLTATILLQHGLGVLTALALYAALRSVGAAPWTAAIPAAVVLFGGIQIYLEHAPLSEPLFGFLIAVALYGATRSLGAARPLPWLAGAGLLLGAAAVIRPAGLLVAPAVAIWVLFGGRSLGRRAMLAAVLAALAALPLVGYVVAQDAETGFTGITRSEGWTLYGRVAEFAECSHFDPPKGTARLCERTPPSDRPYAAGYLFTPGASPAVEAFGRLPSHDDEVGAFARAAILGQPLAYARTVARDFVRYAAPNSWVRAGGGFRTPTLVPYIQDPGQEARAIAEVARYWDTAGFKRSDVRQFDAYANATAVEGPLVALFAALAIAGLFLLGGVPRRTAALFGVAALALMLLPVATLSYDVRYATPAYGPLAAAAALGLAGIAARLRAVGPEPSGAGAA